ncbi:MAG: hypothetical protein KF865_03445 [Bdellovibrionaceae bacterium]|nr:hypothetical protein [Pseudobdellovibrionaceae bacterium]
MRGFLVIIISSFVTLSCTYHVDKTGAGAGLRKQGDVIDGNQPIGWALMKTDVLQSCLQCHSGGQQPTLSSLPQVQAELGRVWSEVSSKSMPPPRSGLKSLSDCRTAVLKKWIDLGAPENSTVMVASVPECPQGSTPIVPIGQAPLTYNTLYDRILAPKCLHCHNPQDNTDAGAVLFYPYSELVNGRKWNAPAQNSKVVRLLRSSDLDVRMPPPEAGDALAEEEIQFIERWIDAGKPEL